MNVPIMAWDQGRWLDPNRFLWGEDNVAATSVPYFDSRCGMKFTDIENFKKKFENFWECVLNNKFKPRKYILENLTLEKSAQRMLDIVEKWK